jgi:periplasmic protein TonB
MTAAEAAIRPRDRLSFAVFLVTALHAAVIFGVSFVWQTHAARAPIIEVTLAQHSERRPEHADFIAQSDQLASGDLTDARETTAPRDADVRANELQPVLSDPQRLQALDSQPSPAAITTVAAADEQVLRDVPVPEPEQRTEPDAGESVSSDQIASIEARFDYDTQVDAKGPRIRRLTSAATRSASEAAYINSWIQQVQSVGNLHYPAEALRRQLFGELTLLVTISADGTLQEISVLTSSGHAVLDDAAIQSVRLSAPFPPFPAAMRRDWDVLQIERTWQFRRNAVTSSS